MIISAEGVGWVWCAGGELLRLAQKIVPSCVRWHARRHSAFDICVPASQYPTHWASVSWGPLTNGTVAGTGMVVPVGAAFSTAGLARAYPDHAMNCVAATASVAASVNTAVFM